MLFLQVFLAILALPAVTAKSPFAIRPATSSSSTRLSSTKPSSTTSPTPTLKLTSSSPSPSPSPTSSLPPRKTSEALPWKCRIKILGGAHDGHFLSHGSPSSLITGPLHTAPLFYIDAWTKHVFVSELGHPQRLIYNNALGFSSTFLREPDKARDAALLRCDVWDDEERGMKGMLRCGVGERNGVWMVWERSGVVSVGSEQDFKERDVERTRGGIDAGDGVERVEMRLDCP